MNTIRRRVASAAAVALALLLGACGGDDCSKHPTTPECRVSPPPTPTPCNQTSVFGPAQGSIPTSFVDVESFTTTATGRVDVFVDWTFPDSPIGVYVVQGSCNLDQFNARACNFLIRSEPPGTKPRKVSASNVAAGGYQLLIANFADVDESLSTQVFLSTGNCAPFAGSSPAGTALTQARGQAAGALRH